MKGILSAAFLFPVLLLSCFEADERAVPWPGMITTIFDSVQLYQSYFDFESGEVVATLRSNEWQLGFECGADGWHIITNSGANWFIYNTGKVSGDPVPVMPQQVNGLYDVQHAWPESTAVGNWTDTSLKENQYTLNLYLLGKLSGGTFSQVKELIFLEVSDTTYRFLCRESGNQDTVTIIKNDQVNFVYYSFDDHVQTEPEPANTSYDLVFLSYYDLATLFGQTIPYQVGGALLNILHMEAALDTTHDYNAINLESISEFDFRSQRDIPGYNWKSVTVDITGGGSATYIVRTHHNYIFRTAQGNYFKMRFLSYSLDGRSGYPRFEYSRLE